LTRPDIVYCAPGSGLGHVNRALAVCLQLRALGVSARIAANSPFAAGLARAARFPLTGIATATWREDVCSYVAAARPRLIVTDTFPRGFRGEWELPPPAPCLYLARRLNAAAVASLFADPAWSRHLVRIVAAETLGAGQQTALQSAAVPVSRLPGPIRLRPGLIPTPVPAALDRLLDTGRACLVVHGGPVRELEQLAAAAQGRGELALISPWGAPGFDYYPAGNLVHRAAHVVTGAGYNAMADMMHLRPRHTALAFARRFDDQAGRLADWRETGQDGAIQAAQAIAETLTGC
jgi:predicted glycosyltransferase